MFIPKYCFIQLYVLYISFKKNYCSTGTHSAVFLYEIYIKGKAPLCHITLYNHLYGKKGYNDVYLNLNVLEVCSFILNNR